MQFPIPAIDYSYEKQQWISDNQELLALIHYLNKNFPELDWSIIASNGQHHLCFPDHCSFTVQQSFMLRNEIILIDPNGTTIAVYTPEWGTLNVYCHEVVYGRSSSFLYAASFVPEPLISTKQTNYSFWMQTMGYSFMVAGLVLIMAACSGFAGLPFLGIVGSAAVCTFACGIASEAVSAVFFSMSLFNNDAGPENTNLNDALRESIGDSSSHQSSPPPCQADADSFNIR